MYFIYEFRARVTVVTSLALRALASVRGDAVTAVSYQRQNIKDFE